MVNFRPTATADDAEETDDGANFRFNASTTPTGQHRHASHGTAGSRWNCGFICRNAANPIPANAVILSATLRLRISLDTALINADVYGEKIATVQDYSANGTVRNRTRTTATASWVKDASANFFPTIDVVNIVQELVNDPSWGVEKDHVNLLVIGKTSPNMATPSEFQAFEHAGTNEALLILTWDDPPVAASPIILGASRRRAGLTLAG